MIKKKKILLLKKRKVLSYFCTLYVFARGVGSFGTFFVHMYNVSQQRGSYLRFVVSLFEYETGIKSRRQVPNGTLLTSSIMCCRIYKSTRVVLTVCTF